MSASKNFGIRKREAINLIKSMIEVECPGQVSCADILVLAAREAVAISGGPSIQVPLGRRDSPFAASSESADASLPSADIGVDDTLGLFAKLGMTAEEAVAILGKLHLHNLLKKFSFNYAYAVAYPGENEIFLM